MTPDFADHFSDTAASYAAYRPTYPPQLFAEIAARCRSHERVWDCATGSGQAVSGLVEHFQQVFATDASAEQLRRAPRLARVHLACMTAEAAALDARSIDCVTVAQAAHWLDIAAFATTVRRVVRDHALVVWWSYGRTHVTPEIDGLVNTLHDDVLGSWWPPERRFVDDGYRSLSFPFAEIAFPAIRMRAEWRFREFAGYISTWSAMRAARRAGRETITAGILPRIEAAWGTGMRTVEWPLAIRAGYAETP